MSSIREEANSVYVNSTDTLEEDGVWAYYIEAARQEGYARGVATAKQEMLDAIYAAERAAYREGQRDTTKKIISALGLEE